ncbi:hypothetical protein D3C87_979740 [compost metagenome]
MLGLECCVGIFVRLATRSFSSACFRAETVLLQRLPDRQRTRWRRDAKDRPDRRIVGVHKTLRRNHAIAGIAPAGFHLCEIRHRDRRGLTCPALDVRHIIKRRPKSRCRIPVRRQQEAALRIVVQPFGNLAAHWRYLVAEPVGLHVVHVRRPGRGHIQLGDRQDRQRLADEVGVDVLQRRGRDRRIPRCLDSG